MVDENILVVPNNREIFNWNGFSSEKISALTNYMYSNSMVKNRKEVENDTNYKQIIPYVLFYTTEYDSLLSTFVLKVYQRKFLMYRRTNKGNEDRLHGSLSLGIGGHVTVENTDLPIQGNKVLIDGAIREIKEEVGITAFDCDLTLIGVINDNTNDVGKVHVGMVYMYNLPDLRIVAPKEDKLEIIGAFDVDHLWLKQFQMETWSQIIVRKMYQ